MLKSTLNVRIYYEDTDCGGVVYYANYLRYFERARTELLREAGVDLAPFSQKGTYFVVTRAGIVYKAPAGYQDLLRIETEISELSRVRMTFTHDVYNHQDRLVVRGDVILACVSGGRPRRMPEEIFSCLTAG